MCKRTDVQTAGQLENTMPLPPTVGSGGIICLTTEWPGWNRMDGMAHATKTIFILEALRSGFGFEEAVNILTLTLSNIDQLQFLHCHNRKQL